MPDNFDNLPPRSPQREFPRPLNLPPRSPKPEPRDPPGAFGLLDGFLTREELAREWGVHVRTIARYEAVPDGLPYMQFGGRRLYPVEEALAFMLRHLRRPNPTRRAG